MKKEKFQCDEELLTFEEAIQFLKISSATLYRLIKAQSIPAHKIGHHWRFFKSELVEWVKEQ